MRTRYCLQWKCDLKTSPFWLRPMFFVLCTSVSSTQQPLSVPFWHQQLCFLFINFDPELSNHSKNNYFVHNETFCRWMTYFDLGTQSWVSPPPRTLVSPRYIGPIYQRKTFISPSYQWKNSGRINYVTIFWEFVPNQQLVSKRHDQ